MRTTTKLIGIVMMLCLFATNTLSAQRAEKFTMKYGGVERTYYFFLPKKLSPQAPLVFILHGYGGNAEGQRSNMLPLAEKEGFAVCIPQGHVDGKGKPCWNVGYPFQEGLKTDDIGFLAALAKHLQKTYGLNPKNCFLTGHSNGGEMCYLLAYSKRNVFTALAPISGLTLEWMYRDLHAVRTVPLMEVHGTQDVTSKWNGDPDNLDGWGKYIAVPRAVGYWAAANRCTHEITEQLPLKSKRTTLHRYVGGTPVWEGGPAAEVWFYEVEGGAHGWPDDSFDVNAELWRFFSKYLR